MISAFGVEHVVSKAVYENPKTGKQYTKFKQKQKRGRLGAMLGKPGWKDSPPPEGFVEKSWKKMAPKYAHALANMENKSGQAGARHTYRKMRYAQGRIDLGEAGKTLNGPTKARALTRIKQRQAKDNYRDDLDTQLGKKKKRNLP